MLRDISNLRKSYSKNSLIDKELPEDPFFLFDIWFKEVSSKNSKSEVNAMTLSTIGLSGYPNGRIVLLKYYSHDGFVFLQIIIVIRLFQSIKIIKFQFPFFGKNLRDK